MQRGRLQDAVQIAETMLKLTISYRERILQTTALFERDIDSVNYTGEIIPTLKNARAHIAQRLETEGRLLADVNVRMDEARGDDLRYLAANRDVFKRATAFNTALIGDLIAIDERFLGEQARQRFRPNAGAVAFADPTADVLLPALKSPVRTVFAWMNTHWHLFLPPEAPAVPSLTDLAQLLLQDPQPHLPGEVVEEDEAVELAPLVRFDAATVAMAAAVLEALPPDFTLTEALAAGRKAGLKPDALLYLALRVLQWYEGGDGITVVRGRRFADPDFAGDDLAVARSAP
jgi:hypothetical protein